MCGCAGGFGGGGGGGGGTGNISGNLTAPFLPVATGLHAIADSGAEWVEADLLFRVSAIDLLIDDAAFSYGLGFSVDHDTGAVLTGGTLGAAGLANLNGGIAVDTDKFTVAGDGTGNTVIAGTLGAAGLANLNGGIAVDTDKFTVAGDGTGNTVIAGTLGAAGLANLNGGIAVDTNKFVVAGDGTGDTGIAGILGVAGLTNLNGGIAVDTDKFTVADGTGNTVIGGTADLKGQVTIEKSTILGIGTLALVSGSVDIDADLSDFFEFDWSANATINAPSNPRTGRRFLLRIRTIGTTGHTLTWDGVYVWQGDPGTAPAIDEEVTGYWYLGFVWNEHNSRWHSVGNLAGPYLSA